MLSCYTGHYLSSKAALMVAVIVGEGRVVGGV